MQLLKCNSTINHDYHFSIAYEDIRTCQHDGVLINLVIVVNRDNSY